jgi:uncharacterized protein
MKRTMHGRTGPDPRALILRAACAEGQRLADRWPLAGFERLLPSLAAVPADADVAWQADASERAVTGGEPERWLHLRAQATVPLQCQRCLGALAAPLAVDRHLRFVAGEDEAERLDEELEDDVLALPPRLDLHELLEDELILALPLVPRHDGDCPEPLPAATATAPESGAPAPAAERVHPFAALASLRKPGAG